MGVGLRFTARPKMALPPSFLPLGAVRAAMAWRAFRRAVLFFSGFVSEPDEFKIRKWVKAYVPPMRGVQWGYDVLGQLLLEEEGVLDDELLADFAPEAVHIRSPDGTDVTSGNLATGMTVPYSEKEGFPSAYTLVVPGDCTGLGLGSDRDVQAVQSHLLGEESLTGPYLRAADLDNDGQVTVEDLVLFDTPAPTPTPVPTTPQPSQTE